MLGKATMYGEDADDDNAMYVSPHWVPTPRWIFWRRGTFRRRYVDPYNPDWEYISAQKLARKHRAQTFGGT